MEEPVRMAMVGGGSGAFIGPVHRCAAELDGQVKLVSGCFSSDPKRAVADGQMQYGLPAERCYPSYQALFDAESARPDGAQFVGIVTPNHSHHAVAKAALQAGLHVVCDKPVTVRTEQALELMQLARSRNRLFCVTYNYTGYPMVKQARHLVASGAIGEVRRVVVEYLQGWLAQPIAQDQANKQAAWRLDPQQAGLAGCFGDIGSHAQQLLQYVVDSPIASVQAQLATVVSGRVLDDDGNALVTLANGARGVLMASQIATGEENALRLRVYGQRGALSWEQMEPNTLRHTQADGSVQLLRTGTSQLVPAAAAAARLPAGHPEGFLESFANLYRAVAQAIRADAGFQAMHRFDFPNIYDGLSTMRFLDAVLASSQHQGQLTPVIQPDSDQEHH